jgi:ectoine hydroxylase-related dioxygenase (phytanoyl-CoA dioxygenase family)
LKWISQYTGLLRQLRILYWLNNLVHFRSLKRNRPIYRSLGIRRSVLRSIDSRKLAAFVDLHDPALESQLPVREIQNLVLPPKISSQISREGISQDWDEQGYIRLSQYFSGDAIDQINELIREGLVEGKLHYNYTGRKIFNAHRQIRQLEKITADPGILSILALLFKRQPIHFQTINFQTGSEQAAHSDSIHMTTLPLGYLAGVWVALEKTHPGNGPLTYYPGSHKLPYVLNADYGNCSTNVFLDGYANEKYEHRIRQVAERSGIEEVQLNAEPGDVFIWHANLLHGGAPILDKGSTRRSMVSHYFAEDVLCFHEISERPAILKG